MERFGIGSHVLSTAVPLFRNVRTDDLPRRRAFFEEVLAEGGVRRTLADNARLDTDNTLGLLARYGRDTAGALQIWDEADPLEPRIPEARPVTEADVKTMFREVKSAPLGNSGRRRVSSLAGVQDKILLVRQGTGWAEPLDGFPSTHIVKPINTATPSLIFDEEYGSRFVRALGLASFATTVQAFDGTYALVIERFDRDGSGARIHQEDFNQALGYIGDRKYEAPGETDRLRKIAGVLRTHARAQDLHDLLRMTALSVVLHNYDMHAKNIGLLHSAEGEVSLAPMYDVIPSAHLDVDQEFALAVNGKRAARDVTLADVVEEGRAWGVRSADRIVKDVAELVIATAEREKPLAAAHGGLDFSVGAAAQRLLDETASASGGRAAAEPAPRRETGEQTDVSGEGRAQEVWPSKRPPGGWGGPVR
ncbi:hypothetical protein LUZ63_022732 [Rhynchospora breviuscula]|uniref:EF-hand domain-containing protein n=1 Tax=Rhynchospora breviuscula TaxID=2022672 RepID=A0A9P9Z476_9POAL|nr:hypothetical protein LUZ63_022732 [Rhynchospora breviuscula]